MSVLVLLIFPLLSGLLIFKSLKEEAVFAGLPLDTGQEGVVG